MENAENRKSASFAKIEYEPTRTGLSPDTLARALRDNLYYTQGRMPEVATPHDWYCDPGKFQILKLRRLSP